MNNLKHFVPSHQSLDAITAEKLSKRFATMPHTYQQDGMGDEAVAHFRYHTEDDKNNWFITEKDMETEQLQAYGLVDLACGYGAELGYISLVELCEIPLIKLDTSFEPTTLGNIKKTYLADEVA